MTRSRIGTYWDWSKFKGSAEGLRLNRRDLEHLEIALTHTPGRKACIQAGGNLGIFPKALAAEFEAVYTFEPDPILHLYCCQNAPEQNIVRFQAALGRKRQLIGTSRTRRDGKPIQHEGTTHIVEDGIIPTIKLDDLKLPYCDLIYLDVEGWELYALEGAILTISRLRPTIAIEINRCMEFVGVDLATVMAFFDANHYVEAETIRSDHIFIPRERAHEKTEPE